MLSPFYFNLLPFPDSTAQLAFCAPAFQSWRPVCKGDAGEQGNSICIYSHCTIYASRMSFQALQLQLNLLLSFWTFKVIYIYHLHTNGNLLNLPLFLCLSSFVLCDFFLSQQLFRMWFVYLYCYCSRFDYISCSSSIILSQCYFFCLACRQIREIWIGLMYSLLTKPSPNA